MDGVYRGFETSMLALVLGLAVAALSFGPRVFPEPAFETSLPMISVTADAASP